MIKLKLSDGRLEMFNLKNFEREKALYFAWYSMRGDPKYGNKLFRITTDAGEKLELKIGKISECTFEECTHVRAEVKTDYKRKKKGRPSYSL